MLLTSRVVSPCLVLGRLVPLWFLSSRLGSSWVVASPHVRVVLLLEGPLGRVEPTRL